MTWGFGKMDIFSSLIPSLLTRLSFFFFHLSLSFFPLSSFPFRFFLPSRLMPLFCSSLFSPLTTSVSPHFFIHLPSFFILLPHPFFLLSLRFPSPKSPFSPSHPPPVCYFRLSRLSLQLPGRSYVVPKLSEALAKKISRAANK